MQYNWKYRIYCNGKKKSPNFSDVVPNEVNTHIDSLMWYPYTTTATPFRQVTLQRYREPAEFGAFLRSLSPRYTRPARIWQEFKQSIFENWMPNKIHLIGASSGYDSRLIAKAVQEITQKHGPDW